MVWNFYEAIADYDWRHGCIDNEMRWGETRWDEMWVYRNYGMEFIYMLAVCMRACSTSRRSRWLRRSRKSRKITKDQERLIRKIKKVKEKSCKIKEDREDKHA